MSKHGKLPPELAELLAAYGDPPQMPKYQGDSMEYLRAVRAFEVLSATPEAVARRAAMERYFCPVDDNSTLVTADQHPLE